MTRVPPGFSLAEAAAIRRPSAENVTLWIWERLQEALPVRLVEITLFETPTSSVTYAGE